MPQIHQANHVYTMSDTIFWWSLPQTQRKRLKSTNKSKHHHLSHLEHGNALTFSHHIQRLNSIFLPVNVLQFSLFVLGNPRKTNCGIQSFLSARKSRAASMWGRKRSKTGQKTALNGQFWTVRNFPNSRKVGRKRQNQPINWLTDWPQKQMHWCIPLPLFAAGGLGGKRPQPHHCPHVCCMGILYGSPENPSGIWSWDYSHW